MTSGLTLGDLGGLSMVLMSQQCHDSPGEDSKRPTLGDCDASWARTPTQGATKMGLWNLSLVYVLYLNPLSLIILTDYLSNF